MHSKYRLGASEVNLVTRKLKLESSDHQILQQAMEEAAFAVKMLGGIRQEIIFARHQKELRRAPQWLSVPVIGTSHVWENGNNEQSHQDPLFGEALMGNRSCL